MKNSPALMIYKDFGIGLPLQGLYHWYSTQADPSGSPLRIASNMKRGPLPLAMELLSRPHGEAGRALYDGIKQNNSGNTPTAKYAAVFDTVFGTVDMALPNAKFFPLHHPTSPCPDDSIPGNGFQQPGQMIKDDNAGSGAPPSTGWQVMVSKLHVVDIAVSQAFWCGLIGFKVAYERPGERCRYPERRLMDGCGAQIILCQRNGRWETGPWSVPWGRGNVSVGGE